MPDSFGARVRQHRERHGVSLIAVAEQTKIKMSLLEGLERDDLSHWPNGIFRRAYVRSYAVAIGLDADRVTREFLSVYTEPVEVVEPTTEAPTRLRSLLGTFAWRKPVRQIVKEKERDSPRLSQASETVATSGSTAAAAKPAAPVTAAPPMPMPAAVAPAVPGLALAATSTGEVKSRPQPKAGSAPRPTLESKPVSDSRPVPESKSGWVPMQTPPPSKSATAPKLDPVLAPKPAMRHAPDLLAAARLCTELGRVEKSSQIAPLLREAARILDARGVIVWVWDALTSELKPALVHGYPERVRKQLPSVRPDADNATATAFRTSQMRLVAGPDETSSAIAVPLMTADACAGVLAIELPHGSEEVPAVQAVATFFAAQLAQLVAAN